MPHPSANDLYEVAAMLPQTEAAIVRAAAEELVERRKAMRIEEDRTARIKAEARAIGDALGSRGLIDFADDVRMLAKL